MCGVWLLAPTEIFVSRLLAFGLFAYGGWLFAPTADHLRWWLSEYGRLPLARWPTAYLNNLEKKAIMKSQKLCFFFIGVGVGAGVLEGLG